VNPADEQPVTLGRVVKLWWPLAGSWLLMGIELPLFSAIVARMAEPKIHLAAFSAIVFPVALLIEGPIMMLLAAGAALARDMASYRKLYRFMTAAGAALTAVHVLVAFTPLYDVVATVMDVEPEVREPGRWGLMIMTPWTWAIAHRRYQQGVLIRFGRSGEVWLGTLLRVTCNASILLAGLSWGGAPGIVVGTAGFAAGVTAEAAYVAWRTGDLVRGPLATAPASDPLSRARFLSFYAPLALSPILMLVVQPLGAAAMNRMPASRDSLAAWSSVWGLVFITRSVGFALNEVVVALLGRPGAIAALRRFTVLLATGTVGILVLIAATPLAELWFRRASGLPPELVEISRHAVAFAILMPGYQAIQSWYQGALVHEHRTRAITEAVVLYLVIATALLATSVHFARHEGIYYAILCFSAAGVTQTAWLAWRARSGLRELAARADAATA
jgi:hypothetical protein